jgi:hypothetical protein
MTVSEKSYVKSYNKLSKHHQRAYEVDCRAYLIRIKDRVVQFIESNGVGGLEVSIYGLIKDDNFVKLSIEHIINTAALFADFTFKNISPSPIQKRDSTLPSLNVGFFSETWRKQMEVYAITESSKLITLIDDTTRKNIQDILAKNVGLGSEAVASKIAKSTGFKKARALTISITETAAAANYGSYIGASQSGVKLKKRWSAAHDERTRPAHAEADGKIVKFNEMFLVGGVPMKYPCDPAGGTKNVIRCRCVCVYAVDSSQENVETDVMVAPVIELPKKPSESSLLRIIANLLAVNQVVNQVLEPSDN